MNAAMKNLGVILFFSALTLPAAQPILPEIISFDRQYELFDHALHAADLNKAAPERGAVRFSLQDRTLYVELEMDDLDCTNTSKADQEVVHRSGDAVRLFLRPSGGTQMWELQSAFNGKKGVFLHWGVGRMFYDQDSLKVLQGFKTSAQKTQQGWRCRMAVDLDEAARKLKIPTDISWQIMVMRYNYGKNHPRRNVSSFPQAAVRIPDAERFALLPDVRNNK